MVFLEHAERSGDLFSQAAHLLTFQQSSSPSLVCALHLLSSSAQKCPAKVVQKSGERKTIIAVTHWLDVLACSLTRVQQPRRQRFKPVNTGRVQLVSRFVSVLPAELHLNALIFSH